MRKLNLETLYIHMGMRLHDEAITKFAFNTHFLLWSTTHAKESKIIYGKINSFLIQY